MIRLFRPSEPAPDQPVVTVRGVIDAYLRQTGPRASPQGLADRRRVLCTLADDLDIAVVDCRPLDLSEFLDLHNEWASDWTRRRVVTTVQAAFNWARRAELIPRNPFQGVTVPQGEPGRPMRDDEFRAVLRLAWPAFRRALLFMRWTGCRPGELAGMAWPDVDLPARTVTLRRHKTSRTRRDRRPRVIVLPRAAARLLAWLWRRRADEGGVFRNEYGRAWNRFTLARHLRKARRKAGVAEDCKLYSARHAYATRAVMAGVAGMDLKTLSVLLGHTTVRMSEHYVHLAGQTEHLRRAAELAGGCND